MANENEHDPKGEQPIRTWTDWLERWRIQRAEGDTLDGSQDDPDRPSRRFSVFTVAMIAAAVCVVAVMVIAVTRFGGDEGDDSFEAIPVQSQSFATSTAPTTAREASTPQCAESDKGDSLTTSKGGEVTSPQRLVAEFQHRYFDLRDGAAVAELWDEGYEAEGFQATIDDSLAELDGRAGWCLTVAPAERGWWSTEVSWWQQGDQKVRETWYGTYKIERRGSGFIFTDVATE